LQLPYRRQGSVGVKLPEMSKKKGIAVYTSGFLLLAAIFFIVFRQEEYREIIVGISLFQAAVTLAITFGLFFINGYMIAFMASHHYKTSIGLGDVALLPLMMHLWSFIIPFRGGLLFSAFFLKMKYNIKGAEGIAIGVFTTMISLVLTGLCGIYFTFYNNMFYSSWTVLAILLSLSPLIIFVLDRMMQRIRLKNHSLLDRLRIFTASVTGNSIKLLMDYSISAGIFSITIAGIALYILFIVWVTCILHIEASLDKVVIFALMMRLSVFVRIVPGNIGVQELLSGGSFYLVGGNVTDGLAIALFVRFFSLLLTFSLGVIGIAVNMNHFKMRNIRQLWADLRNYNNS
jgi:uncharacterized membrane protein YbhN (UPF0104 family)